MGKTPGIDGDRVVPGIARLRGRRVLSGERVSRVRRGASGVDQPGGDGEWCRGVLVCGPERSCGHAAAGRPRPSGTGRAVLAKDRRSVERCGCPSVPKAGHSVVVPLTVRVADTHEPWDTTDRRSATSGRAPQCLRSAADRRESPEAAQRVVEVGLGVVEPGCAVGAGRGVVGTAVQAGLFAGVGGARG